MKNVRKYRSAILIASAFVTPQALAQTAPDQPAANVEPAQSGGGLAEIVVTAEKRSTNLQKTPVAVSALSNATLAEHQVRLLTDVQALVPNFTMGSNIGVAQIAIRGIGTSAIVPGAEGAVAVNINDIYISRPVAQLAGVYDLANIEVLRGPQGTLYGRNATAGSVNISTALPTDSLSGYGRLAVGNYATVNFDGAISGPIAGDALEARLAVSTQDHSGYGTNLVTGKDIDDHHSKAVRLTLRSHLGPNVTATLFADYYHQKDDSGALHYFGAAGLIPVAGAVGLPPYTLINGGYVAPDVRDIASQYAPSFKLNSWSIAGRLEAKLGDVTLKSITGYRDQNSRGRVDLSGGSYFGSFYLYGEPAHQFSQEVQASLSKGPLDLTVGGYYFNERDETFPGHAPFTALAITQYVGAPPPPNPGALINVFQATGVNKTRAYAFFGQATYKLTDRLSITGGLRYSNEFKRIYNHYYGLDFSTPFSLDIPYPTTSDSARFKDVSPKASINYQVTPNTLLYATYSRGFKSGGFDVGANAPAYKPEKLTDYEGGIKTTLVDRRLRVNLAGFYYDYSDLQVQQVINTALITTNAATATVWGGEAEINFLPTPSFSIDASLSYLHARFNRYLGADPARPLLAQVDFSGNRLPQAPDWHLHLSAQKTWTIGRSELRLRGEGDYVSRNYFLANNFEELSQAGNVKFNAFLTLERGPWQMTAFIRNIFDKTTKSSLFVATDVMRNPELGGLAPPRTFGAEIGYHF